MKPSLVSFANASDANACDAVLFSGSTGGDSYFIDARADGGDFPAPAVGSKKLLEAVDSAPNTVGLCRPENATVTLEDGWLSAALCWRQAC